MTAAKTISDGQPDETKTEKTKGKDLSGDSAKPNDGKTAAPGAPAAAASPVRKPLGTKEVIPFAWKLIGDSGKTILTLFKTVQREEAEAQLDRLSRDDYYTDLRIVDIDFKTVQPKPPKPPKPKKPAAKSSSKAPKKKDAKKAKSGKAAGGKTKKAPKAKAVKKKRATRRTAVADAKPAAKKKTAAPKAAASKKKRAKTPKAAKKATKKKARKKTG